MVSFFGNVKAWKKSLTPLEGNWQIRRETWKLERREGGKENESENPSRECIAVDGGEVKETFPNEAQTFHSPLFLRLILSSAEKFFRRNPVSH